MANIKLKQYIRDNAPQYATDTFGNVYHLAGRPRRIGVIVSTGPGKIGYSIIHEDDEKSFKEKKIQQSHSVAYVHNGEEKTKTVTKNVKVWDSEKIWERGTFMAAQRADGNEKNPAEVPRFVQRQIDNFKTRMEHYYNPIPKN
jgi:hypothetical protein